MNIALNARFQSRTPTGVEHYANETASRLGAMRAIAPQKPKSGLRGHAWEQMVLPLRLHNKELLWSPCNTGPLAVRNQVVTVHDCAFLDRPDCFTPTFAAWYGWLMPRLARRVRSIITVSEFSKSRLVERMGTPADKIDVIYNGVDPRFQKMPQDSIDGVRRKLALPARYVLTVGSRAPRKNLARLIEAWQLLGDLHPQVKLVVVGAKNDRIFREGNLPEESSHVQWTGYVDQADLPSVYSGAELFMFPSEYEGFGLPLLEAMACGVPVASSSASCLPEVAGDAARYFNPLSCEEMAAVMRELLNDDVGRETLRERGTLRMREFTWERTAAQTARVLKTAMENN